MFSNESLLKEIYGYRSEWEFGIYLYGSCISLPPAIFVIPRRATPTMRSLRAIQSESRSPCLSGNHRGEVDVPDTKMALHERTDASLAVEAGQQSSWAGGPDRGLAVPCRGTGRWRHGGASHQPQGHGKQCSRKNHRNQGKGEVTGT